MNPVVHEVSDIMALKNDTNANMDKPMTKRIIPAVFIAAVPTVGHAERWEESVTLYGWLPGIDTSIATDFGDVGRLT
jgi:hypothetical protein